jgi:hypothetical protein
MVLMAADGLRNDQVVPRRRAVSPLVRALADAGVVPLSYGIDLAG